MPARNTCARISALAIAIAATVSLGSASAAEKFNLSGLNSQETYSQFIVQYRGDSPEFKNTGVLQASLNRASQGLGKINGQGVGLERVRRLAVPMELVRSNRELNRGQAEKLMREIAADPNVLHVEPDLVMKAIATPNDTRYSEQWHYYSTPGGLNAPTAWNSSTGAGVVVAVVDSGIIAHTDLSANILPGYDFISQSTRLGNKRNGGSEDGNGRDADPTDVSNIEHGTHVAGTIAAVTNNANGVAGVAYNAKVVPIRVLGRGGYGNTSDIVDGIVWAAGGSVSGVPANANPAEVINLSLGGASSCTSSSAYQTAINTAVGRGAVVVVAAGNSNQDVATFTPASCANVVAVAANDIKGNRAMYSNYGAKIDVTAPGGETWSCTKGEFLPLGVDPSTGLTVSNCTAIQEHPSEGVLSTVSGNGYDFMAGTSMAAPHVAGVAALMQAAASTPLTPAEVEATLKSTARAIPSANCPGGCGAGYVDAAAAVSAAAAH